MTINRKFVLAVTLFVFIGILSVPVHAMDKSVEIKGTHKVEKNESLKTGRHTFILSACDESFPMPEGSSGKTKEVTINSNEAFSFGDIHFTKQGNYKYILSRKAVKTKDLKIDKSVYTIKITVFADGTVTTVYGKDKTSGKPDKIKYTDVYQKKEKKGSASQTGDDFKMHYLLVLMGAVCVAVLAISRKEEG